MAEPVVSRRRPFEVFHFFTPPQEEGGGVCVMLGRFGSIGKAVEVGTIRLTQTMDPSPHDRIQIRAHVPGEAHHPTWLYRDADGRVCLWRLHPTQPHQYWGHAA